MRNFWIALALPISGCVSGDYCQVYVPLDLTRQGASALVQADRPAAEAAAINEESWRDCP